MWIKFTGGIVPDGYEIALFPHTGLMIRQKRPVIPEGLIIYVQLPK